jgi:2-oxoglutarate ferredoxin oxidoreductase subunit alpha
MVERVIIPPEEQIERWERKKPEAPPNGHFDAFRVTGSDLVPPIAHAGEGYKVHYTGLTHDQRGYPDMSAETHDQLVKRLIAKVRVNAPAIIRIEEYHVEDASIVVVAYGCTARSARSAVRMARSEGIPVGLLRLISLWPFPEAKITELASTADEFIVAEMNLGQISLEVERLARRPVKGVFHAGGAMIPPDMILAAIREAAGSKRT